MNVKYILTGISIIVSLSITAQTQTWQWVKAGGSTSDNADVRPAVCKIAGCDAYGNVYAVGEVNGHNMSFDTFSSPGAYSIANVGISYLLFSYDCSGNMRWAKQIGDNAEDFEVYGAVTDPQGNTYFAASFFYGNNQMPILLYLGDTILPTSPTLQQQYLFLIKYDSLGQLVWFKNYQSTSSYNGQHDYPLGLRLGSSGNLWMLCNLDSNYVLSPNLHSTLYGKYNIEIEPDSGEILGGYYIEQNIVYGDGNFYDASYDMDENENFYECGTLNTYGGSNPDTLILANQIITPNVSLTSTMPFIYSLDKNGNFRFIVTNTSYSTTSAFNDCKYDFKAGMLVSNWIADPMVAYGNDTLGFNPNQFYGGQNQSCGLFAVNTNGNILWGKCITYVNTYLNFLFKQTPTAFYSDHIQNNGLIVYNNTDTLYKKDTSSSVYDYSEIISQIDINGNLTATYTAHLGNTGNGTGANWMPYGATDWRGNVYLGGTVTNFFATPADSVVNTDANSGNFLIAKLGIADCSCPIPGVQFTQTVVGDTVFFYGSSINHSDSIRWRLGDGGISSSDTFFHVYTNHDSTYSVTAIAYSGCGVDSITKLITVTSVGIKAIEPDKTNLYPNPATNSVYIDVSGPAIIGLVFANGSSVWSNPIQVSQQGTYVFDMSKYSCAMYYFIVQYTNGKTDVMQIVKE